MAGVCVKDTQGFRFSLEFMSWKSQEEIIIGTQWLGGFSNGKNKRLMIQNTCIQVKKFKKTCFCWKVISLDPKSRKAKLLLNCERRKEKWAFPAFLFGNLFSFVVETVWDFQNDAVIVRWEKSRLLHPDSFVPRNKTFSPPFCAHSPPESATYARLYKLQNQ